MFQPRNAERRPLGKTGALEIANDDDAYSVTRAAVVPLDLALAELLALSDRRDMWERRLLDAAQAAYAQGYADGRADERIQAGRAWAAAPVQRVSVGPTLAELELLRWGPGGREHFGDPRPGDRLPRQERAA